MYLANEAPASYLKRSQQELRQLHAAGGGGFELARRRADLLDLVLISLFREAEQRSLAGGRYRQSGLAVVALGGYGRRELAPHSDVDLMLLYDPDDAGLVQEIAEQLFYPLWDAGLELGHGARTVDETVAVAADSFEDRTSFLQARYVVGNQDLYREFTDRIRAQVLADGGRAFIETLLKGREARHQEYGASAALLEPHLKEGRGGLRDLHELLWAATALDGGGGADALIGAGWLAPEQLAGLEAAVEVLLRARTSLHHVAGRKVDRLYLDYQEEVAELLGGGPRADLGESMAAITDAAHAIALLTSDAWEALLEETGVPSRRRPATLPPQMPTDREGRRALLLELLREGYTGLPRLERLCHLGYLSEWLPGWADIRYLGQRDNLHTYTVDGHAFHCVAVIGELATTNGPDRLAASLASELALSPDWEAFLLGALLHDIGKGVPEGDHCETGAELAAEAAAALGMSRSERELISFLVREHLLLIDTATRRDLDDERLLERVADRVGSPDRLEMLYVLTAADSMSTGAASWTPWIATLVQELVFKVRQLLASGPRGEGAGDEEAGAAALRDAEPAETGAGRVLFFELVAGDGEAAGVSLEVREGQVAGVQELTVTGPVHRGLLTRLSGVLSHQDVNIMSAQVQPAGGGVIARSFQVSDQFDHDVPLERWERVAADLGRALEGRLALEYHLAQKAARQISGKGGPRHPTRVVVDNAASDELTVLEVHAHDRIGLLHTVARTLDDLLLEVRVAKVSTVKERVVDVFYVADVHGGKITEPDHVREVERALLFALDERA